MSRLVPRPHHPNDANDRKAGSAASRHDRLDVRAVLILVGLCTIWGVQQTATKVAVAEGLPPLLQAGLRTGVAAICVCIWIAARQGMEALRGLFRRDGTLRAGSAIAVLFALEFLFLFPGLKLTTASRGVVFLYTAPFFTALGAHFVLPAERLRPRQVFGLLIAFAGVAVAFADGFRSGGGSVLGDAMCAAAGAFWGATTVTVKASPGLMRASAAKVLLIQLAGSTPLLLLASAFAGEMTAWPNATPAAWAWLGYQTFVVAFASFLAWFWLVRAYPAGQLAGFTFLTPLFGILAGALLLGEHAGWPVLIGLVAIAAGLRLLNAAPRRALTQNPSRTTSRAK